MMDRRNFLKWGAAGIAGAVIGNPKKLDEPKLGEDEDTDSAEKRLEQKEEWKSEHFQKAVKGHAVAFGELTNEELLFFMPDGSPLSKKRLDPISSEEGGVINVFEQTQRGRKFNQKWLDEMRKLVCKENVNKIGEYEKSTGINVLDVEKYLPAQITFSRLISSAKEYREEIETFLDVAFYNGANIMPNDLQNRSRIQYIKEEIGSNIDKNLPETIRDELIELTPGLCALESGYDPQATSSANAKGVFQFLGSTFEEMGSNIEDIRDIKEQTKAAGKYYGILHGNLVKNNTDKFKILQSKCFKNEKDFQKYFLTPCIINSYNSGLERVSNVLKWFFENYFVENILNIEKLTEDLKDLGLLGKDDIFTLAGYDMYHVMSRLAAKKREVRYYGKESSSYFVRIFTLKELIKNNADRLQEFAPLPTPSAKPKSKLIPPPNPVPKSRIMP